MATEKKKRLTLTGSQMPDDIYKMLSELGADRKLTPYIVSLIEKEKMMDKLIESLSILSEKTDRIEKKVDITNYKLDGHNFNVYKDYDVPTKRVVKDIEDDIKQGHISVGNKIEGGIDEPIEEMDY